MNSTNFGSMLIFASCVGGTCNILVYVGEFFLNSVGVLLVCLKYIYTSIICIIVICFFGHISSFSHLCPKRRVGWAHFDRRAHVARGLGAIRVVCRAW